MSKPKTNNLAAALNKQAKGAHAHAVDAAEASAHKETTRQAKVMISAWFPITTRSSFHLIQAKHPEKKMQDLLAEAVNDLFAKYNVPQAAGDATNRE